jgi:hypothetical protein
MDRKKQWNELGELVCGHLISARYSAELGSSGEGYLDESEVAGEGNTIHNARLSYDRGQRPPTVWSLSECIYYWHALRLHITYTRWRADNVALHYRSYHAQLQRSCIHGRYCLLIWGLYPDTPFINNFCQFQMLKPLLA